MSAAVLAAFAAAALSVVAGIAIYRHAYAYPELEGNTPEYKKSYRKAIYMLIAVFAAATVEIIVAAHSMSTAELPSLPLYASAIIAACSILGGLVLGSRRGKHKLTPTS